MNSSSANTVIESDALEAFVQLSRRKKWPLNTASTVTEKKKNPN